MNIKDIFSSLAEFQKYTDGMVADTTLEQLGPSIRTIIYDILKVIPPDAFNAIIYHDATEVGRGIDMEEGAELLRTAIANGAAYKYQIFASVKKNGSDASFYKYQHEEIKEHHQEAYWTAMDRVLDWLDENPTVGGWEDTFEYQKRQALPVKNAYEFDYYYGIGKSSFFFQKILFLVRQTWEQSIMPVLPENPTDKMLDLAKQALCYQVIAQAVMQFDTTELPRSIRYDNSHEYTKGSNMQQRTTLYNQLMAKVSSCISSIERLKIAASGVTAIEDARAAEGDKYFSVI